MRQRPANLEVAMMELCLARCTLAAQQECVTKALVSASPGNVLLSCMHNNSRRIMTHLHPSQHSV